MLPFRQKQVVKETSLNQVHVRCHKTNLSGVDAPDGSYRCEVEEFTDVSLIHASTTRTRLLCCCTKLWSFPASYSTSALKEKNNLQWRFNETFLKAPAAKCVDQTLAIFSTEESFCLCMLLCTWGNYFLLQSSPCWKIQLKFKSEFDLLKRGILIEM